MIIFGRRKSKTIALSTNSVHYTRNKIKLKARSKTCFSVIQIEIKQDRYSLDLNHFCRQDVIQKGYIANISNRSHGFSYIRHL